MKNLPWASPAALNAMSLGQLLCLAGERPPTAAPRVTSFEDYRAALDAKAAEEAEWSA